MWGLTKRLTPIFLQAVHISACRLAQLRNGRKLAARSARFEDAFEQWFDRCDFLARKDLRLDGSVGWCNKTCVSDRGSS